MLTKIINSRGLFRENDTLVGYVREVENVAGSILKAYAPNDRPSELARLGEIYEAIRTVRDTLVSPPTASVTFTGPTHITGGVAGGDIGAIINAPPPTVTPLPAGLDPVDDLVLRLITIPSPIARLGLRWCVEVDQRIKLGRSAAAPYLISRRSRARILLSLSRSRLAP